MNKPLSATELKTMKILDPTGHTTVTWSPDVPDEVAAARETFIRMTREGYSAFRVSDGKRGERITTFDAHARSLVLVPQLVSG